MQEDDKPVEIPVKKTRDERGRWLPGYAPNPNGRKNSKRDILNKLAKTLYGEDFEHLFASVAEIAAYDQRASKDKFPKWTGREVLDARKFLFDHIYDKPMQRAEVEIEQKVLNINLNLPSEIQTEDF